ncbi:MAG TPA: glycine cleavage system protein GcvH [Spirochaetia bacterium]|jgi:glycine cleavage system H protein|nr:glycine cleavage system protein GcvH [Spirochaetia bacterium]
MSTEKSFRYAKTHEWVRVEGNRAFVGISDHAQHELGDIVYVELPKPGTIVTRGKEAASIESVKAASPIYSPVSGTVVEVNTRLDSEPELVNKDPYGAFLFVLELSDPAELETLLDEDAYNSFIKEEN